MTTLMLQYEIRLGSDLNELCSKIIHTECVFRKIDYMWVIWRGGGWQCTRMQYFICIVLWMLTLENGGCEQVTTDGFLQMLMNIHNESYTRNQHSATLGCSTKPCFCWLQIMNISIL